MSTAGSGRGVRWSNWVRRQGQFDSVDADAHARGGRHSRRTGCCSARATPWHTSSTRHRAQYHKGDSLGNLPRVGGAMPRCSSISWMASMRCPCAADTEVQSVVFTMVCPQQVRASGPGQVGLGQGSAPTCRSSPDGLSALRTARCRVVDVHPACPQPRPAFARNRQSTHNPQRRYPAVCRRPRHVRRTDRRHRRHGRGIAQPAPFPRRRSPPSRQLLRRRPARHHLQRHRGASCCGQARGLNRVSC